MGVLWIPAEILVPTKLRQYALLTVALMAAVTEAHGGAWTQEAGRGQIILTSSFFRTDSEFSSSGIAEPFANGGHFQQLAFSSYFEVGVTRRTTLLGTVNAPVLRYWDSSGSASSAGLGDTELGVRRRFNSVESPWAVSGQLVVMFPAYPATRNPAPGNHQEDVEARLLVGRGASLGAHHCFWDAEAGYRYRYGPPADQFRADFTSGIDLTRRVMVMGQMFAIKGMRNGQAFSVTNPNAQSDFDLYKAQASLVVKVARSTRVQAGWNDSFSGRNTGRGSAAILALWINF